MMTMKHIHQLMLMPLLMAFIILSGCNPSNSGSDTETTDKAQGETVTESTPEPTAPSAVTVALSAESIKTLSINWTDVAGATPLVEDAHQEEERGGEHAVVDHLNHTTRNTFYIKGKNTKHHKA